MDTEPTDITQRVNLILRHAATHRYDRVESNCRWSSRNWEILFFKGSLCMGRLELEESFRLPLFQKLREISGMDENEAEGEGSIDISIEPVSFRCKVLLLKSDNMANFQIIFNYK